MSITITCGHCGQQSDFDNWTRTPVAGELPRGHYQCPACGIAFKRQMGPSTVYPSGLVIGGDVELVPVQASL